MEIRVRSMRFTPRGFAKEGLRQNINWFRFAIPAEATRGNKISGNNLVDFEFRDRDGRWEVGDGGWEMKERVMKIMLEVTPKLPQSDPNINENLWKSMKINENQRKSTKINEHQRKSTKINDN